MCYKLACESYGCFVTLWSGKYSFFVSCTDTIFPVSTGQEALHHCKVKLGACCLQRPSQPVGCETLSLEFCSFRGQVNYCPVQVGLGSEQPALSPLPPEMLRGHFLPSVKKANLFRADLIFYCFSPSLLDDHA